MASSSDPAVTAYLAAQPPAQRRILNRVRTVLRSALPGAVEAISYGIPAFKLGGKVVVFFAGWKEHFALYPISAHIEKTLAKEMAPYEQSKRGTIRFKYDERLPVHLIAHIAKLRAAETATGGAVSITQAKAKQPAAKQQPAAKMQPAAKSRSRPR